MIDQENMTPDQLKLWKRINQMMDVSYGCAESFVVAVSEHLWGEVDKSIQMISTGFSGGVGGTHEELCGGVSGAAIILGLLYGRTTNDEDLMIRCKRLISEQRDRFCQEFGTTVCQELRDKQFGADEDNPCSAMIAPAAFLFLEILNEEKEREAQAINLDPDPDRGKVIPFNEYKKTHHIDKPESLLKEILRMELPHQYRDWIGDRLNEQGDPRKGVGLTEEGLPNIDWLPVLGGSIEIERAGEFHVEDLYISKYIQTFQQFQVFIDDPEGFKNPEWWKDLSAAEDHRALSGEQRFRAGNYPRDNVSWYDAIAFCRWLNDRIQFASKDHESTIFSKIEDDGWEIRLPAEWEWQMAATGGAANHKFPWGLDWDENKAHTKHNQLNKSLAVGMYPMGKSPGGAYDMSGNVWEWCLNCYDNPADLDFSREDRRVLRGGSWYHWGSYAHTDMRSRYFPNHRYNAGGFRIVCGKPIKF